MNEYLSNFHTGSVNAWDCYWKIIHRESDVGTQPKHVEGAGHRLSNHTTTPYHETGENVDDDEFPIKISLNLHSIFRSLKLPAIKPTEMTNFLICCSTLLIQ